jgi:hypothetical protein
MLVYNWVFSSQIKINKEKGVAYKGGG